MERFDHHCPWLGNCIAKRNYSSFYMFTVLMLLTLLYLLTVILVSVVRIFKGRVPSAHQTNGLGIFVLVLFFLLLVLLVPALGFVAGLWGFHTYIIWTNQSTNEYLKEQWKHYGMNPFRRHALLNCWQILSYPAKKSFLSMRVVDFKEKYLEQFADRTPRSRRRLHGR